MVDVSVWLEIQSKVRFSFVPVGPTYARTESQGVAFVVEDMSHRFDDKSDVSPLFRCQLVKHSKLEIYAGREKYTVSFLV
jgi:hypothetical protein